MGALIIFLNELSFTTENAMHRAEMLPCVLSTLAAIRTAKRIRNDVVVVGSAPISGLRLGDGTDTIASILGGNDYREEWRFLRILDQTSPWDAYPTSVRPGELQEVRFQGRAGIGLLWAKLNDSAILSFAFSRNWDECSILAQFHEIHEEQGETNVDIEIPNLSKPEHAETHRELIGDYARTLSQSALVYEGEGFVIRMYFNDHNPPHFHVLPRRDTSETLAEYRIDNIEILVGSLQAGLRRKVEAWARSRADALAMCWDRCRAGQHPISLNE